MASHRVSIKNLIWAKIKFISRKFWVLLLFLISCDGLKVEMNSGKFKSGIVYEHSSFWTSNTIKLLLCLPLVLAMIFILYCNFPNFDQIDSMIQSEDLIQLCPLFSSLLIGPIQASLTRPSMTELASISETIQRGGIYEPTECISRYKVAIIIPYRSQEEVLEILLHNIHPVLQRQQLNYGIFIIEQSGNGPFNQGMLKNIGFVEVIKRELDYDCFIFYDVNQIPEDDRNLFVCDPDYPSHLSSSLKIFNYKFPYLGHFSGVVAFTREQFERVNGFSNEFWNLNSENDDLYGRVLYHGYDDVFRHAFEYSRFTMHEQVHEQVHDKPNQMQETIEKKDVSVIDNYILKVTGHERYSTVGLNSLKYETIKFQSKSLYTWMLVDVLDDY